MKPTVLLDCDEVLADFTAATLQLVHELTGHQYERHHITTWEIFDSLKEPPAVKKRVYGILKEAGGCMSIPRRSGAQNAVEELKKLADIVVVTHPFEGSPTWAHEREQWLEKHFGLTDVIHTRNKARVHGDVFVDDKATSVTAWLDYWEKRDPACIGIHWENGRTLSYERDPRFRKSTSDWDEVLGIVQWRSLSMG